MSEHASHHTNVQTAKKLTEKRDAFVDAFARCCISHISYCFLAFSLLPPSQFRKVALVEGNYKPCLRHAAVVFLKSLYAVLRSTVPNICNVLTSGFHPLLMNMKVKLLETANEVISAKINHVVILTVCRKRRWCLIFLFMQLYQSWWFFFAFNRPLTSSPWTLMDS